MKKENLFVILTGVIIGIAALVLTALGNPANMGFCIACFERDIAGAVGLHSAAKVQYVRPEIIGLVLGSFLMAIATKQWKARAGSSPALRFVLGAFVMIGALAFLGCPLRMVLRLGGGKTLLKSEVAAQAERHLQIVFLPVGGGGVRRGITYGTGLFGGYSCSGS